ncbi:MAG: hypothetical protein K2R93_12275 [Gemmatimonadaceae bacterium]|nr:hypothetical protein [Gemmatimonadaceae bacterium]
MPRPYTIKAHPTTYAGVRFRSRLEARWAAFFDLAQWKWQYEPIDLAGWSPDFLVQIPCGHSECPPTHDLYVEVKPYTSLEEFRDHVAASMMTGLAVIYDPAPALFGVSPVVTEFELVHGSGGGIESVMGWVHNWDALWKEAGNITQWRKPRG